MTLPIESALKVSAILLVALGATFLLRHRSAAVRHWILSVAIMCALAAPVLGLIAPSWAPSFARFSPAVDATRSQSGIEMSSALDVTSAETDRVVPRQPGTSTFGWPGVTWLRVLGWVWIAGAGINLLLLGVGLLRVARLSSRAQAIGTGRWKTTSDEISGAIALRRAVRLLHSDEQGLLVTWGFARPEVLLPAQALDWSSDRARIVLRHELAHVARGDWAVQMTAEVLRALYWFNPLVWIVCVRLRQESERACDDAVLNGGIAGPDYAGHLLDLARTLHSERQVWTPTPAMARPSSLEGRITAMLNARINRRPLTRAARIALTVGMLCLALTIAGAQGAFFTFSGSVVDQTNRGIPDAAVVLSSAARQATYEIRTDKSGRFDFVGLPNGEYILAVETPGFAVLKEPVRIAGRDMARTFELQVGSLQETINVRDQAAKAPRETLEQMQARAPERRLKAMAPCSGNAPVLTGGTIVQPVKLVDVRPDYPEFLKNTATPGIVKMDATIGADGSVKDVRVIESSHPALESAAVDGVRQWQYSTTFLNCVPVDVHMTVTVNFLAQP